MEDEDAEPAISEAQWDAAREAFEEQLPLTAGLTVDKYDLIVDVLRRWEELTPGERRLMAGGNRKPIGTRSIALVARATTTRVLLHAPESGGATMPTVVSHQGRMFDDIKAVHCASARTAHRPPLHSACALLPSWVLTHLRARVLQRAIARTCRCSRPSLLSMGCRLGAVNACGS